jgi:hypothetical protein
MLIAICISLILGSQEQHFDLFFSRPNSSHEEFPVIFKLLGSRDPLVSEGHQKGFGTASTKLSEA